MVGIRFGGGPDEILTSCIITPPYNQKLRSQASPNLKDMQAINKAPKLTKKVVIMCVHNYLHMCKFMQFPEKFFNQKVMHIHQSSVCEAN